MGEMSYKHWGAAVDVFKENGGFFNGRRLREMGYTSDSGNVLWVRRFGAPVFQFQDGKLIDMVGKVNRHLSATDVDAYDLACWWTMPDDDGTAPMDLIDKPRELWKAAQTAKIK